MLAAIAGEPLDTSARRDLAAVARAGLTATGRIAGQCALLTLVYLAGSELVRLLGLSVPGNLVGMLLLLGLLAARIVRPTQLDQVGGFFLTHLTFFFVPFALGLMAHGTLFAASGPVLVASLVVGAMVGIAVAGLVTQLVARR